MHRYDINRRKSRHGHKFSKYKKYVRIKMVIFIKQRAQATSEAQFMKKLCNTKTEVEKSVAYRITMCISRIRIKISAAKAMVQEIMLFS